jgi:hypothetical protein
VRLTPPALPALGEPDPAELREPVPLVEVTRFQVALNVDETPPSVDDVEFRPTQLMPRAYTEPRIVSDSPSPASSATPGDELDLGDPRDPGDPAWIVDRPLPPDPIAAEATEPTAEARTPGSDFVLPANPLQNLSDESLEGFVDCTLYEEAVNVFHPGLDDRWDDPAVELAAAGRREIPRPGSVPAMPFDAAPDLMVHSIGGTESLAVSPIPSLAAAMAPEPVVAPMMPAGTQPPPYAQPPSGSWPPYGPPPSGSWQGSAPLPSGAWPSYGQPPSGSWPPYGPPPYGPPPPGVWPPYAQPPSGSWPPYGPPPGALPPYAQPPASAAPGREPGVPAMAGPAMLAAPIAQGARPPMPAMVATTMMTRPGAAGPIGLADWRRWLLIGGTAVAAILIAFLLAKLARGRMPIAPGAPPAAVIPKAAPRMPAESRPGVATARSITLAAPGPSAVAAQPDAGAPADREDDAIELAPADDDAEPPPGAIPVVGAGPCRFTVATVPSGSLIRFDEDPVGGSPLTILGSCEQHKLDVSHARYQTVTRWVTLTADRPASVEFTLPRPIHAVTVTSQPPGAEVMIDGRRVATTPAVVRVPGFARISLTLTKPGFRRITRQIYSKLAQDRVFVKLAP